MLNHKRPITKPEIKALLGRTARDDLRTTILEIGCNNGSDSQDFLNHFGENLRLYCFDPDPRAIDKFRQKINDPRCQFFDVAIAAEDGETQLFMSGGRPPNHPPETDWDMSSSIRQPTGHFQMSPWCTFDRHVMVRTVKLDTWLSSQPEIGTIDFIWADVQGAEVDLIHGGREALKRTRFLVTEYYQTPQYKGQINLDQIMALLGPNWQALATYEGYNVLCRNRKL